MPQCFLYHLNKLNHQLEKGHTADSTVSLELLDLPFAVRVDSNVSPRAKKERGSWTDLLELGLFGCGAFCFLRGHITHSVP